MSKHFRARPELQSNCGIGEEATELSTLVKRIVQLERDQKADEDRIDAAITKTESEIARLEQRNLSAEELQKATITVRDRAILIIRDVRQNMVKRAIEAKNMQKSVDDDFLRQRSRFAADDLVDANLRTRFFKLLESTPTFVLVHHLLKAIEIGNAAYAEAIRFEFQCRNDRHRCMASFEMVLAKILLHDPVEMRKRLMNIRDAAEKVDTRVTDLLRRTTVGRYESTTARKAVPSPSIAAHAIPFFAGHHSGGTCHEYRSGS
jgi:hypothetical protein